MTQRQLATWLTFIGTAPFVLGDLMLWLDFQPLFLPGSLQLIIHSYAVVVACFVAGMQWGVHLTAKTPLNIYLYSGIVALLMWGSLLLAGSGVGLGVATAGLFLLWLLDFRIFSHKGMPAWFFGLRTVASLIAICALLFFILF